MQHLITPLIPCGAAYFPVPANIPPRKYAFLLLPGFTLLAFSAAVEPFRIANQLSQKPLYHWQVLSEDGAAVRSSSCIPVEADFALQPMDRDITLFVCSGVLAPDAASPQTLAQIARHHRHGGRIGGICTGAVALARAGLLDQRRFTLHWENQPGFIEDFPDLLPSARKFEIDQRILTCSGGVAAADLALHLIAQDHGRLFAAAVTDMCLHRATIGDGEPQRTSLATRIQSRNPTVVHHIGTLQCRQEGASTPSTDHANCPSPHLRRITI